MISVWHPSFLALLLDALPRHWERLLADLPDPERLRDVGPHCPERLWPHLQLINCWGDAHAELALADLKLRFPHTHIQSKGLLATEAFVTVPFGGAHLVAVLSHFFEFLDKDGRLRLVHELVEGQIYEVVVTTSGGLWRYRLGDLVRVSGLVGKRPSLRFLGRTGNVSDRFGEKLSEHFVADVIREVTTGISPPPLFAMLAPTDEPAPRYVLYLEGEVCPGSSSRVDELLRRNPQYDVCRRLGQLEEVGICQIRGGYNALVAHEMSKGRRPGEIKPKALSQELGWQTRFSICPKSGGRLLEPN